MTKKFSIHDWQDKQRHLSLKLEQGMYIDDDEWEEEMGRDPKFGGLPMAPKANNGEIEISLEDLDFETLKASFPNNYQKEKFIRPQTGEPYYEDSISFPNLDDSLMTIGDSLALEDWKDKTSRRFGNVTIVLKPYGKNWFDKVFVDDDAFNAAREKFIMGKMSALNR